MIDYENLYSDSNQVTYCPEDNKLRLYIGRVPREEYEHLRELGYTVTPKQDCDFVAHWSPEAEDIALAYAGYIGDEDQSPTDRAADRAERFAIYREKRTEEVIDLSLKAESLDPVHGYQSAEKAVREVNKHKRLLAKVENQWAKAEYWTYRTAGVIRNALHKSDMGTRLGRLKKLEAEQRAADKSFEDFNALISAGRKILTLDLGEPDKSVIAARFLGHSSVYWKQYTTPEFTTPIRLIDMVEKHGFPAMEALKIFIDENPPHTKRNRAYNHLVMRIAYEKQMIENSGGSASDLEYMVGGWVGKYQIWKISKSSVTKKVTSITVLAPAIVSDNAWETRHNIAGTEFSEMKLNIERATDINYRTPTNEDLKNLEIIKDQAKAAIQEKNAGKPKLLNPTPASAERLQKIFNESTHGSSFWDSRKESLSPKFLTQAQVTANSKGEYAPIKTKFIGANGKPTHKQYSGNVEEGALFKIRYAFTSGCEQVIVITDKPQTELPEFTA